MKYVLITAGNTSETIDGVRKITNTASGKLGSLIAESFIAKGVKVIYVCSNESIQPKLPTEKTIIIQGVLELDSVMKELAATYQFDCIIHSMAVSDYTVASVMSYNAELNTLEELSDLKDYKGTKLSSQIENPAIILKKAPKILSYLKSLFPASLLIGFKLLVNVKEEELYQVAYKMMKQNSCDYVCANDFADINHLQHKAMFIRKDGTYKTLFTKEEIAKEIVTEIMNTWEGVK